MYFSSLKSFQNGEGPDIQFSRKLFFAEIDKWDSPSRMRNPFEVIVLIWSGKVMTFVLYPLLRSQGIVKNWNTTE